MGTKGAGRIISKKTTLAALAEKQKENPVETRYRIYSVLSYVFVLVAIGLPIWWLTTRVYRASLPLARMIDAPIQNESHVGIPLALEYDVLVTIVHPDPENLELDLNGKALSEQLDPFLKQLAPIANFTVKSQWLYLVELGVIPRKHIDHFAIAEEQLPHVITPLEKKLWSHMSQRPCLNLVLYVTHCRAPLHIYDKTGNKLASNSFTSPRWGGVYIVNPPKEACEVRKWKPNFQPIVSTFVAQVYKLLNLPEGPQQDAKNILSRPLLRQRVVDMVDSTRRTLRSLAQLLSEINNIVISDEVAQQITDAVENADQAIALLEMEPQSSKLLEDALKHSQKAYVAAETAFSDPSLLALLYFPDDQKYAIYIPLFLPVMIPVCMSLHTVRKWYKTGTLDSN